MSHPHNEHRAHKVEHRRVHHIAGHYAHGGGAHGDMAADKNLVRKMVKKSAMRMDGGRVTERADRRARGGRTKHGKTNVNVIVGSQHPPMAPPAMPMRPPVMMPPPRPPMAPPPGMPPGGPPGLPGGPPGALPPGVGGMPPPGLRRSGGRTYAKGGAVKPGPAWNEGRKNGTQVMNLAGKNDGVGLGRGKPITYAKGGKVKRADGGQPPKPLPMMSDMSGIERLTGDLAEILKPSQRTSVGTGVFRKHTIDERASGGAINAPQGVAKATKLPGGSGGGLARLAKAKRATHHS